MTNVPERDVESGAILPERKQHRLGRWTITMTAVMIVSVLTLLSLKSSSSMIGDVAQEYAMQALSSDLPSVTQLMIVTANGSIPLFQLTDWTVIDLSVLPPIKIEIQTDRKTVGSVSVVLDGSVMAIRDANPMFVTDQESLSLSTGSHSISITPFSQSNAIGAYGLITTIKFIVANDPTINVVKGMGIFTGKGSSELVLASDEPYPLPIERPHDSLRLRLAVPASYGVSLQITIDNYLFYEISSYPYDLIWSDVQIGIHSFNVVPTIKGVNVPEPTTFYVNVVRGDSYTLPIVPPSIDQFTVYDAVGDYIVANMTDGFVFNAPSITENVVSPTIRVATSPPLIGSVEFKLNNFTIAICNHFPYRIGDTGLALAPGQYDLSATPYYEPGATGAPGPTTHMQITFQ